MIPGTRLHQRLEYQAEGGNGRAHDADNSRDGEVTKARARSILEREPTGGRLDAINAIVGRGHGDRATRIRPEAHSAASKCLYKRFASRRAPGGQLLIKRVPGVAENIVVILGRPCADHQSSLGNGHGTKASELANQLALHLLFLAGALEAFKSPNPAHIAKTGFQSLYVKMVLEGNRKTVKRPDRLAMLFEVFVELLGSLQGQVKPNLEKCGTL